MMPFTWINVVLGLIVASILAYKMAWLHDRFGALEMSGMGFIGGAMILTIGPLLWPGQTPYENWAGTLMRLGLALYFVGRILRYGRARRG